MWRAERRPPCPATDTDTVGLRLSARRPLIFEGRVQQEPGRVSRRGNEEVGLHGAAIVFLIPLRDDEDEQHASFSSSCPDLFRASTRAVRHLAGGAVVSRVIGWPGQARP